MLAHVGNSASLCITSRHRCMMRQPQVATGASAHPQSAVGSSAASQDHNARAEGSSSALTERNSGSFRFWHDERRFKGTIDKCLVQQALFAAGGVRTGGYPKTAPMAGPLGYQRSSDWDMLWSPARSALRAVPLAKAGQLVSAVPGMYSLTKKRRLSATLHAAYGADAWQYMPRSFSLPAELGQFRDWLQAEEAAGRDLGPWMLKTAQHLGKGLVLLPGMSAYQAALQPRLPSAKPFVLAQRYVSDPLLINGCKFGIRLWLLVTNVAPFTCYLHNQGLVLFSTDSYDLDSLSDQEGAAGKGHITNYAQNVNGTVWNLAMLKKHLGPEVYRSLWGKLVSNAAHVACAAMGEVRREHTKQQVPPNTTFELLGLDYLVDSSMHPWLLEVNGTPSLAVAHHDPQVEQLIYNTKNAMVQDMVNILDVRHRFMVRYGLHKSGAKMSSTQTERAQKSLLRVSEALAKRKVDAELQHRGGFLPLMAHYPVMKAAAASAAVAAAGASSSSPDASVLLQASSQHSDSPNAGLTVQQAEAAVQVAGSMSQQTANGGASPAPGAAAVAGATSSASGAGEAPAGGSGGHGGSSNQGIHFSDCDKRLFVYMQQWWQKQRAKASSKKQRLLSARKRLKTKASTAAAAADGSDGVSDQHTAMQVDEQQPVQVVS